MALVRAVVKWSKKYWHQFQPASLNFSWLCCLLIVMPGKLLAEDVKYPVSSIAEDLKKNANRVYRVDEMTFTIYSRSRAVQQSHVVITILNGQAKSSATQAVAYSRLLKVNEISGAVYDKDGKLIRKLKSGEIADQSATGSELFSDLRVKIADLSYTSYPYTIEFSYEVEYKFLFYVPTWYVVPGEKTSIERSKFSVAFAADAAPRYKIYNSDQKATAGRTSDGKDVLTWEFKNIAAIESEFMGPSISRFTPVIKAAPGNFQYEGYAGSMNTWADFGLWIASLNKDRDNLPEETKRKARELVQGEKLTEEKIRILYKFLQDKTRYVSVQIGIGGQQPFEAKVVDETSYGDCKALSNYMVSLLKAVGIPANYVLIRAGREEDDIDPGFPSTQFNHAVVAVPMEKDTLWLECTSQTNPFGYAGQFTGDRHAVMITSGGASVVHTPRYPQKDNQQLRSASIAVGRDGNATAKVKTVYTGLRYDDDYLFHYANQSVEEQKKWILKNTSIPSFDLTGFTIDQKKERLPEATVSMDLKLRSFASVSGKRLFVNPNLMNRVSAVQDKTEVRKTDIVSPMGYIDEDVVEMTFPEDLYPEFVPKEISHESRFGSYRATFEVKQGSLVYSRKLTIEKGTFPPDAYGEFLEFYKNVSKADNVKLVFLSKT